jgi:hypothetical protein
MEFRNLILFRLGLPLYEKDEPCHFCGRHKDRYGVHSLICKKGSDHSERHNTIRNLLFLLASQALLSPKKEVAGLIPCTKKRPGDIVIPRWHDGRTAAIDVTIISPLQQPFLLDTARAGGFASKIAEDAKVQKHGDDCKQHNLIFLPFAMECTGGYGPTASHFLEVIVKNTCDRRYEPAYMISNKIYQRMSFALQKEVARSLCRRGESTETSLQDFPHFDRLLAELKKTDRQRYNQSLDPPHGHSAMPDGPKRTKKTQEATQIKCRTRKTETVSATNATAVDKGIKIGEVRIEEEEKKDQKPKTGLAIVSTDDKLNGKKISAMICKELKEELKARSLPTYGTKAVLVKRLLCALQEETKRQGEEEEG